MSAHRCPQCGLKHDTGKAWRIPRTIALAVFFAFIEGAAARRLDGLLSVALWVMVAYNLALVVLLVWGLALTSKWQLDRDTEAARDAG